VERRGEPELSEVIVKVVVVDLIVICLGVRVSVRGEVVVVVMRGRRENSRRRRVVVNILVIVICPRRSTRNERLENAEG